MKLQVLTDQNGYIESYLIVDECIGSLDGAIEIELEEEAEALPYVYDSYQVLRGKAYFDKDKLEEEINQEPPKSREEELEERIAQLEAVIAKLGL